MTGSSDGIEIGRELLQLILHGGSRNGLAMSWGDHGWLKPGESLHGCPGLIPVRSVIGWRPVQLWPLLSNGKHGFRLDGAEGVAWQKHTVALTEQRHVADGMARGV